MGKRHFQSFLFSPLGDLEGYCVLAHLKNSTFPGTTFHKPYPTHIKRSVHLVWCEKLYSVADSGSGVSVAWDRRAHLLDGTGYPRLGPWRTQSAEAKEGGASRQPPAARGPNKQPRPQSLGPEEAGNPRRDARHPRPRPFSYLLVKAAGRQPWSWATGVLDNLRPCVG